MNTSETETPLHGGQLNPNIVKIGETVHRAQGSNAKFVHRLLGHLEAVGFSQAPHFLGIDSQGREILTYFEGAVIPGNGPKINDKQLENVSKLIKRYHDITAGSDLAGDQEIVMQGDLGPHNTVFQGNDPIGLIDWDEARPGTRLRDFAYAVDCYIDLINEKYSAEEQVRRLKIMCASYGWDDMVAILEDIRLDYHKALANHQKANNTAAVKAFEPLTELLDTRTAEMKKLL